MTNSKNEMNQNELEGLLERIDKVHEGGCMNWITTAWATMFIKQGIIKEEDAPKVADAVLKLWNESFEGPPDAPGSHMYGADRYFIKTLGEKVGGNIMMARTQPSSRQMMEVRHQLMKQMCRVHDLQEALLELAEKHTETVMPGYTHFHHAQPTTFGHYILSVADAIERSAKTLEQGYSLMNLSEMGCGALAGTSWPIDRDLTSHYLGMEGLIENANDAVSYTDGYLVVVCALTNISNIASRIALDFSYWSGVEYGILDVGHIIGHSFMMPQKEGNPNSMERLRAFAGQMIGHLTSTATAGLRAPHGDVFEMLHLADPTLAALKTLELCLVNLAGEARKIEVHKDRLLSLIRESYISSTELANQMVRDYEIGYRTAHNIVHEFVLESQKRKIPATEANAELLDNAAEDILGRKLNMPEERLRELLDPEYFMKVTNSKGGIAPDEIARMIADRRGKLEEANKRHLSRIETLEDSKEEMFSELRRLNKE